MDKEIIKLATEKKYTDFSDAIKTELKTKLASHDVVSNYVSEIEKINNLRDAFSKINNDESGE